jgi:hypothetical protein
MRDTLRTGRRALLDEQEGWLRPWLREKRWTWGYEQRREKRKSVEDSLSQILYMGDRCSDLLQSERGSKVWLQNQSNSIFKEPTSRKTSIQ